MIGDQLEFGTTASTPGAAAMWQWVNSLAQAIKALDPAHPVVRYPIHPAKSHQRIVRRSSHFELIVQ